MGVEREVGLAIACLLGTDDGIRHVFRLEHGATAKRELGSGMVLDSDVQHGLVFTELHLVYIKLESVRFVAVARIGPNFLCPSADSDEGKYHRNNCFLVHCYDGI